MADRRLNLRLLGIGAALAASALLAGIVSAASTPRATGGGLPGMVDVIALGADPTGKQDSAPAFQRALGAKEISKLVIPCGQYRLGSMVTVPYGKMVEGFGDCSRVDPDAGITAFKLTGSTGGGSITTLRDLRIWQVNPHPANIGVLIDHGATGMEGWVLERVSVLGSGVTGEGRHSGIGIRSNFGLTGTIRDCVVQWWDIGIDFQPVRVGNGHQFPNANLVTGSKIRANRVGLRLVVQTGFLIGNTIEANHIGINSETDSGLVLAVFANHFENLGRGGVDLEHRGGRVTSIGNTYAGVVERPTVIVGDGGAATSVCDVLTSCATAGPQRLRIFGSW
jgi:hypothetical protein